MKSISENIFPSAVRLWLFALVAAVVLSSCSGGDPHEPASDDRPFTERFDGVIATGIPSMGGFVPLPVADYVEVKWSGEARTSADVTVGEFEVYVEQIDSRFRIGAMHIAGVACTRHADGSIALSSESFECQAGQYSLRGSLSGVVRDGRLSLTLDYKAGSMPFMLRSEFTMPSGERYEGSLLTGIPSMGGFEPLPVADHVVVEWTDAARTSARVTVGAFEVFVEQVGARFSIADIVIPDVACVRHADGSMALSHDGFECRAGQYAISGTLSATLRDGRLTLTLDYKVGSMPFRLRSEFDGRAAGNV